MPAQHSLLRSIRQFHRPHLRTRHERIRRIHDHTIRGTESRQHLDERPEIPAHHDAPQHHAVVRADDGQHRALDAEEQRVCGDSEHSVRLHLAEAWARAGENALARKELDDVIRSNKGLDQRDDVRRLVSRLAALPKAGGKESRAVP